MKRLFILACLLVVLGVLLVDPFGGRREPVDTSSPVLPSNAGEALLGDPDPIPDSGPPPETREAVEVDSAPAADETSVEEGIHVSGTIVVLDEEGIEHPKESGSFTPISWHGEFGAHGAPVDVQEGRFELRMPSGKQFGLKNLRLGDRFARLKEYGPIEVSDGSHLELLAAWAPPIVLHVVDSASRRDLEGIELVRHSRRRYLNKLHPGDYDEADVVRRGATSPLELPTEEAGFDQPRGQVVLWVRAPSYAWGRIKVGYTDPVGHTLELSPAGSLEVTLVGELPTEWIGGVPAPPPVLRLREEPDIDRRVRAALRQQERSGSSGRRKTEWEITREIEDQLHSEPPSGEPLIELSPAAEGPTVVEGVRPGIYVLTVEVGDWVERSRYMLGRESVVLEAGRRAGVNVMLELPPWPNARVPLAGTLHRPPAWENSSIALIIEPIWLISFPPNPLPPPLPEKRNMSDMDDCRCACSIIPPAMFPTVCWIPAYRAVAGRAPSAAPPNAALGAAPTARRPPMNPGVEIPDAALAAPAPPMRAELNGSSARRGSSAFPAFPGTIQAAMPAVCPRAGIPPATPAAIVAAAVPAPPPPRRTAEP